MDRGTRLGRFEILSPIGAGGMGEVFKARDTRLDRNVTIKILPPHFADDAQSRARFEREAKAISQLNHAHICSLYDVGHDGGLHYLVMEYIEGQSLASTLLRGPLPIEQVLRYGAEIADALSRAHASGIVHRDLKPSNVMITPSGAKLLDFGLAKVVPAGTSTDIFALGMLLYAMVTGRRAFEGDNKASIIAAILNSEPRPLQTLAPGAPPALDRLIRKCLQKDPLPGARSCPRQVDHTHPRCLPLPEDEPLAHHGSAQSPTAA